MEIIINNEIISREKLTFDEARDMQVMARGTISEMLELALQFGNITQKERDIMYRRLIDWNSLETVGREFGVTRERIRQIEAKIMEKMRLLTQKPVFRN